MKMSLELLKNGMVLENDVYDENGALILSSGAVLTEHHMVKLMEKNIEYINVIKDQSALSDTPVVVENLKLQNSYGETVSKFKTVFQNFKLGKGMPYEEVADVASPIFDEVMTNSSIARNLWRLEDVDVHTFDHSVIVSLVASLLAKWLNYSPNLIKRVAIAGLVHDIGKVTIPDEILAQTRPLSEAEKKIMQTHTIKGYNLLKDNSNMPDNVLQAVLFHHELYDGSGYPHGLKGENIPALTRIITIANVFTNMIKPQNKENYTNPYSTMNEMLSFSYDILDPSFTQTFVTSISNYYVGNVVKLSTGEIGEVVLIRRDEPHRPLVKCTNDFVDLSVYREIEILEVIY